MIKTVWPTMSKGSSAFALPPLCHGPVLLKFLFAFKTLGDLVTIQILVPPV